MVKVHPGFGVADWGSTLVLVLLMLVVVFMVKVLFSVGGADASHCIDGEGTPWCCCC